jgi:hypothetical protein
MDNFNFKNMQLAYSAVYDQNLCESMEELGLIGEGNSEQDQFETWVNELLDEGYDLSDYTWDELYEGYKKLPVGKMIRQAAKKGEEFSQSHHSTDRLLNTEKQLKKMARVADRHSTIKGKGKVRGQGQAELNRRRGEMKEEYDAYDVILEYLLDEGFAETLESAEAIMVNMSEEWIEGILEEREPGVKPYQPRPTQAEVRAASRTSERRRIQSSVGKSGYGPIEKFNKDEDKIEKPGTEVPKSMPGRYDTPISIYSPVGAQKSRTWSAVTRATVGPGEPQAVTMPRNKPRRVIPSRLDRAPKG